MALALGAAFAAAPVQAASSNTVRAALGPPMTAAQEFLKAGKYPEALAKLKEAEAVGDLTPYEHYLISRLRAPAAYSVGDVATATQDFEAVLGSDLLPAADRLPLMENLIKVDYNAKNYPAAADWINRYRKAGGAKPEILELLPQAYFAAGDFPAAAREFNAEIDAQVAAGQKPEEKTLRLLAVAQNKANDDAGYSRTLERLAELYPKNEYWSDLVNRAVNSSEFDDRLRLDGYRLQQAVIGEGDAGNRLRHAVLAMKAGYPAEAKAVLNEGQAHGAFTSPADSSAAKRTLDQAQKAMAQDQAAAASNESAARSSKDGTGLVGLGLEWVFAGSVDKGLALMQEGLAKGGIKNQDEARLHLGLAQLRAGRFEEARRTFDAVQGHDGSAALAHVWSLFAKVGGKVPQS